MSFFDDATADDGGAGGAASVEVKKTEMSSVINNNNDGGNGSVIAVKTESGAAEGTGYVRPEIPTFAEGNGIYALRSFTFSKINDLYCKPGATVLDVCCGAGTNIRRWSPKRVLYMVLADPSRDALRAAVDVYNASENDFPAVPVQADFFAPSADVFEKTLPQDVCFDYALCTSAAAARAFASHAAAVAFLRNATARIRPGGHFAMFFPNAEVIRRLGTPSFRNTACLVAYNQARERGFGVECTVALADRSGSAMPDAEGFLVEPELLIQIAQEECGMKFVGRVDAQENLNDLRRKYRNPITDDETVAMSIFSTFIFEKMFPATKFHNQFQI